MFLRSIVYVCKLLKKVFNKKFSQLSSQIMRTSYLDSSGKWKFDFFFFSPYLILHGAKIMSDKSV